MKQPHEQSILVNVLAIKLRLWSSTVWGSAFRLPMCDEYICILRVQLQSEMISLNATSTVKWDQSAGYPAGVTSE